MRRYPSHFPQAAPASRCRAEQRSPTHRMRGIQRGEASSPELQYGNRQADTHRHQGAELDDQPELERVEFLVHQREAAVHFLLQELNVLAQLLPQQFQILLQLLPQQFQILLQLLPQQHEILLRRQADFLEVLPRRQLHYFKILLRRERRAHVPLHRLHDRSSLVGRYVDADEGIIQRVEIVHGTPHASFIVSAVLTQSGVSAYRQLVVNTTISAIATAHTALQHESRITAIRRVQFHPWSRA